MFQKCVLALYRGQEKKLLAYEKFVEKIDSMSTSKISSKGQIKAIRFQGRVMRGKYDQKPLYGCMEMS
jgi:hypothetical protein